MLKRTPMMGPSRPKGGEWAQETAAGVVRRRARTLGTVIALLTSRPCVSLRPPTAKAVLRNCTVFCHTHEFIVMKSMYKTHHCTDIRVCQGHGLRPASFSRHLRPLTLLYCAEMCWPRSCNRCHFLLPQRLAATISLADILGLPVAGHLV